MQKYFPAFKFVCGALIIATFFFVSLNRIDPDFWWHVKVGEWINANGHAPTADIYSYTMPGYPWIDHEWLTNSFIYALYQNSSLMLLAFIFSLCAALPFFVWLKRTRSLFSLWVVLLGASFIGIFIGVRAQFISFLFFFLLFEILHKRFSSSQNQKLFYALPLLFLLWANLHAGFASGLLLFGTWIVVHYGVAWKTHTIAVKNLKTDILVLLASALAPLINPYGVRLYQEIITVLFSPGAIKYIAEWQSGLSMANPIIILLVALFVLITIKYRKMLHREHIFIASLFFLLFIKTIRHGPLFLILGIPLLTESLEHTEAEVRNAWNTTHREKNVVILLTTVFLFLIPLYFLFDTAYAAPRATKFAPRAAIEFLKSESKIKNLGNIFNDYGWGGYLIYAAPEFKVFIDGRMPHWTRIDGTSAMQEFALVTGLDTNDKNFTKDSWKLIFKKYDIRTVLIAYAPKSISPQETDTARITKNFLETHPRIANILTKLLGISPPFYLDETLIEHGWKQTYVDAEAQVLECDNQCLRLP